MTCGICGRPLKGAESIQRGYGPVCYRRIYPVQSRPTRGGVKSNLPGLKSFDTENYVIPGQMELNDFIEIPGICERSDDGD